MADQPTEKPDTAPPDATAQETPTTAPETSETELASKDQPKPAAEAPKDESKNPDVPKETETAEKSAESAASKPEQDQEKQATDGEVEMKDATENSVLEADRSPAAPVPAAAETPTAKAKDRRKSTGGSQAKSLSKKASKARMTHTDAKPGDHFLVKLKGFPAWPAIICDETMLPEALLSSRPVTAAKPDGTYAEAYAEGGKRVYDRTFPVMYLYTNEFGWVANTALTELTSDKAKESVTDKMRKDLRAAFELASEHHPIDYYKDMLKQILEDLIAQQEAKRAAASTPKKTKKGKGKADDEDDMDVDAAEPEEGGKSKNKKRKADDDTATPQRSDSVKKPKIKLNTSSTPKTSNGAATGKGKEDSAVKSAKSKPKKSKDSSEKKSEAPKEAKMTPEERHARKEKEVLYLRHKLQRGLLTRDQQPQESEMKQMSDFLTLLENMNDLEVSIIRATKINKVLKAIMKLGAIPREEEFKFKSRSQTLLDKWNKLMAVDSAPASAAAAANGVNGESHEEEKKGESNGVKPAADEPETTESKVALASATEDTVKDQSDAPQDDADKKEATEKPATEPAAASGEAIESTA